MLRNVKLKSDGGIDEKMKRHDNKASEVVTALDI